MIVARVVVVKQGQAAFARKYHATSKSQFIFNLFKSDSTAVSKLKASYPGAMTNAELVEKVTGALAAHNYGKTTLLATSLCCDEINRVLDEDFAKVYDTNFSMGGLAGFAFGGVTSFGAMAHHIPTGGDCLIVFGPHVGVDDAGTVGKVNRRGREESGACCGSAAAAHGYVSSVLEGQAKEAGPPTEILDAQQSFVGAMLLPHAQRLKDAEAPEAELPLALYDAQKELMDKIVAGGCQEVAGEGKIALLGGVQINTPPGEEDYFLPIDFEVRDNKNNVVAEIKLD